jgi:hypothetical protein
VLDATARSQLAEVARGLLAAGRSLDEVLGLLRQRGLTKMDSIPVVQAATDVSLAEAKMALHNSLSWADRREQDQQLEDAFWRAMFIECVLSGGQINEPADWATECRERQRRGTAQLQTAATSLPGEALTDYLGAMAANRLGLAFVALVRAGQQLAAPVDVSHGCQW